MNKENTTLHSKYSIGQRVKINENNSFFIGNICKISFKNSSITYSIVNDTEEVRTNVNEHSILPIKKISKPGNFFSKLACGSEITYSTDKISAMIICINISTNGMTYDIRLKNGEIVNDVGDEEINIFFVNRLTERKEKEINLEKERKKNSNKILDLRKKIKENNERIKNLDNGKNDELIARLKNNNKKYQELIDNHLDNLGDLAANIRLKKQREVLKNNRKKYLSKKRIEKNISEETNMYLNVLLIEDRLKRTKLLKNHCLRCGKEKKIFAKGLCYQCYTQSRKETTPQSKFVTKIDMDEEKERYKTHIMENAENLISRLESNDDSRMFYIYDLLEELKFLSNIKYKKSINTLEENVLYIPIILETQIVNKINTIMNEIFYIDRDLKKEDEKDEIQKKYIEKKKKEIQELENKFRMSNSPYEKRDLEKKIKKAKKIYREIEIDFHKGRERRKKIIDRNFLARKKK